MEIAGIDGINNSRVVRLGHYGYFPPFAVGEEGKSVGMIIDILEIPSQLSEIYDWSILRDKYPDLCEYPNLFSQCSPIIWGDSSWLVDDNCLCGEETIVRSVRKVNGKYPLDRIDPPCLKKSGIVPKRVERISDNFV